MSGERSARHHLQGRYLLLQQVRREVSPVMMLIWRIAIRHDYLYSMFSRESPVFPPIIQDQDEMHSVWINQLLLSRDRSEEAKEWTLAHVALDNLVHRACHLAKRARQLRTSVMYTTSYEVSLQQEIISLQNSHENWKLRPIIQR